MGLFDAFEPKKKYYYQAGRFGLVSEKKVNVGDYLYPSGHPIKVTKRYKKKPKAWD